LALHNTLSSNRYFIFKKLFESAKLNALIFNLGNIHPEHPMIEALHVYKDGLQRPDLKDSILRRLGTEKIGFWQALGVENIGDGLILTCHQAEQLMPDLKIHLNQLIRKEMRCSDIPMGGFDVTLYIGINAATPVRCDSDELATLYFHLGPESINVVLRPNESAELDYACNLEIGDVLVIPRLCKHRYIAHGPSAGLALGLRRLSEPNLSNLIFAQIFSQICANGEDSLKKLLPWSADTSVYTGLEKIINYKSISDPTSQENIIAAIDDVIFGQISKGGWRSDLARQDESTSEGTHIRITESMNIIALVEKEKMSVYTGSRKFRVPVNPGLPQLIDNLEAEDSMTVNDAMTHLTPHWSNSSALVFLKLLAKSGSVEFFSIGDHNDDHVR
jgi:hypothetical protein